MYKTRYVVVVDDHTMIRKGLSALINAFGNYKVLFDAANGKDFISQLKPPHVPDIVLLDINMPEMDGYDTAQWITVNYPEIKVIALSTMDTERVIIRMIKCGAKGYVLKDADTEELKKALDETYTNGYFYNDSITRKVMRSINDLTKENSEVNSFVKLSERETDFLKLACSEKTYQQIAAEMFVSERTVDGYRDTLFRKLNVSSRVGLAIYAIKHQLVQI